MKRFFAMALALYLICGAALASEATGKDYGTKVRYVLPECTDYEVIIPPDIRLAPSADSEDVLTGKAEVTMDVEKINVDGFDITVTLSGAKNATASGEFFLNNEDGTDSVSYVLANDVLYPLAIGEPVAYWLAGYTAQTSWELTVYAQAGDFKKAGLHTDQLTFSVSTSR